MCVCEFSRVMRRRQVIGAIGTAMTVGVAGCSGGGGVTGPSTPEETARAYLEAYFAGEYEEARTFTTGVQREEMSNEDVAETAAREPEVNEIVESKQESGNAVVSVVTTAEGSLGEVTQTVDLLMVEQDGWKVTQSRAEFEGTSRPEMASAFDETVEGPVDVAVEYIRQWRNGNESAAQEYFAEDYDPRFPPAISGGHLNLKSVSRSESSAKVVIGIHDMDIGYTFNLTKSEDGWRITDYSESLIR